MGVSLSAVPSFFLGSATMSGAASFSATSGWPFGVGIGSSNRRFQPRLLMAPALLVEFDFRALRHSRCHIIVNRVATRTRGSGAATSAGVLAFPWAVRVVLANPAAVLAHRANHAKAPPRVIISPNDGAPSAARLTDE